ncbi:MAG: hypothetical protein SVV80_14050 [Planctomycetota bacterium]|nr:hypothetical protein [Planctomycetota bacterium]
MPNAVSDYPAVEVSFKREKSACGEYESIIMDGDFRKAGIIKCTMFLLSLFLVASQKRKVLFGYYGRSGPRRSLEDCLASSGLGRFEPVCFTPKTLFFERQRELVGYVYTKETLGPVAKAWASLWWSKQISHWVACDAEEITKVEDLWKIVFEPSEGEMKSMQMLSFVMFSYDPAVLIFNWRTLRETAVSTTRKIAGECRLLIDIDQV